MNLFPLGTVIKVNNIKLCIIGYSSAEKETSSELGYFVVPYPLGFTNIKKMFFIPCNLEFDVISEGYKTKESEQVLNTIGNCFKKTKNVTSNDIKELGKKLKKVALSKEVSGN